MENFDLLSLNDEQLAALKQTEGAVLVSAGAGSGKTKLLTHRVAYLIERKGVSPYNILAITFTNKAAGEMKERILNMGVGGEGVWISTFHSMCAKILRRDIQFLGYSKDFTIYSENDSEKVIKNILSERSISDEKIKKNLSFHLSNWKNGVLGLSQYLSLHQGEDDIAKIGLLMGEYEKELAKNNALDFDDLLRKTYQLFTNYPEILAYYAQRFKYVLVDEFQDTNSVQYDLVKMLASVHGNLFVVGDEDQCIYSWRGANFQNIFNIKKDFPDAQIFRLERNYRSTAPILQIANNVIQHNKARYDKKMWTDKKEGNEPTLYNAYDERDEALYVAKNIERLTCQGYEYKDIAVLMRLNALSRNFEEAFLSYNIPHRVFGGFKFYERAEIRNVIAYLRLFVNPKDDISFEKIINFPRRAIGDVAISKIKALSGQKSMLEVVLSDEIEKEGAIAKKLAAFKETFLALKDKQAGFTLSEFVEGVVSDFKIREAYNARDEEDMNRILNISSLISSVKEFEAANEDANLSQFLETITLKTDTDEIGEGGAVTIATVHAVKGLEFKVVFVVGLEEGIFPIIRTMKESDIEEERRLLYVALTRAEELLYLSHCSKRYLYHESQYQMLSRFIRELGLLSLSRVESKKASEEKKFRSYYRENEEGFSPMREQPTNFFSAKKFLQKEEEKPLKDVSIYQVGQVVIHPRFGEGEIVSISDDGLVGDIIFEDFGKKSLMLELAPLEIKGE